MVLRTGSEYQRRVRSLAGVPLRAPPGSPLRAAHRGSRLVLVNTHPSQCLLRLSVFFVGVLASQISACVLVFPDDDDESIPTDYAEFLSVDAGCDADDWWILSASVAHPAGNVAVQGVWTEIQKVYYDEYDERFFDDYLGSISLDLLGGADWRVDLSSADTFLDCFYDGEYLFRFFAEDTEGDLSSIDFVN